MTKQEYEIQLATDIASFTHNSSEFVRYAFPWGVGTLAGESIREWQEDVLKEIDDHLSNPETRFTPLRIARASGHGIGKSCLIAMIERWAMSTCEDCKVVITANTEQQMRTKTWPEINKWYNLSINKHWFNPPTATSIRSADPNHSSSWRTDAVTWSENNTEAFAGLHNKGKRIVLIFDEASAIPKAVWDVATGAMSDEKTEIIWIVFGNPTLNHGSFYECFNKLKHRWSTKQIDSRTVEGTNKEELQREVDDYGEDSDFIRIRVRGLFPIFGIDTFFNAENIHKSFRYTAIEYDFAAKVIGVDLARSGSCQNVVCIRQGRKVNPLIKWRNIDTMYTASRIAEIYTSEKPDALIMDGGGLGGGIIDRVKQLLPGIKIIEAIGNHTAMHPNIYTNKRSEMYGDLRVAIDGLIDLPNDTELENDLLMIKNGYGKNQEIALLKKEDMEWSPDCSDALAMTYYEPITKVLSQAKKRVLPVKHGWNG
jgi:hypothetical protein